MDYLKPIETNYSRLYDIQFDEGQLITDTESHTIYYDSKIFSKRICFNDVYMLQSETDRTGLQDPVAGKLYIIIDTGLIYYYYNGIWTLLNSKDIIVYDTFYISPDGSDDNSGLNSEYCMATINGVIDKYYQMNNLRIYLLPGSYSEYINISNKHNIEIIGFGENPDDIILNSAVALTGIQNFIIGNITINSNIEVYDSMGNIQGVTSNCSNIINTGIGVLRNSIVNISNCSVNNAVSCAILSDNGSTALVKNSSGNGNFVSFKASNGSIINIVNSDIGWVSDECLTESAGRIYMDSQTVDIDTKEYIENLLEIEEV
jgi:hypothetical protein